IIRNRQEHKRVPRPRSPGWILSARSIHRFIRKFLFVISQRAGVAEQIPLLACGTAALSEPLPVSATGTAEAGSLFPGDDALAWRITTCWSVYSAVNLASSQISSAEALPPG